MSPASSAASSVFRPATLSRVAAQTLMDALVERGRVQDRSGFDHLISPRDPSFTDRARMLFANLGSLPFAQLAIRLDAPEADLSAVRRERLGPDAWLARATATWRLTGEQAPARHTVWLTFVGTGSDVQLAGTIDRPDRSPQPIWWGGPVTTATRSGVTVVVGTGQSADQWLARGAVAVRAVRSGLPAGVRARWTGKAVLEVPASPSDFEAVLGASSGDGYAAIGAVTRAEGPPGSAVRVVVNPVAVTRSTPDGMGLLLSHEVVHVATRSAASPAPLWAVEGLAEEVALRAYPGLIRVQAAALLSAVRDGGAPAAFPTDEDFRVGGARLDLTYAEAGSVCRYVVRRTSTARLGRLYAELDSGRTLAQASVSALGLTPAELTAGWRRDLERQAGRG